MTSPDASPPGPTNGAPWTLGTVRSGRLVILYLLFAAVPGAMVAGTHLSANVMFLYVLVLTVGAGAIRDALLPMHLSAWRLRSRRSVVASLLWVAVSAVAAIPVVLVSAEHRIAGSLLGAGLTLVLYPRYHLSMFRLGVVTDDLDRTSGGLMGERSNEWAERLVDRWRARRSE